MTGQVFVPLSTDIAGRLLALAGPGEDLSDIVRRLVGAESHRASAPVSGASGPDDTDGDDVLDLLADLETPARTGRRNRYEVTILGETIRCDTLGRVLACTFERLGDVAPELFEYAHRLRGRNRRYLARTREELYPSSLHLKGRAIRIRQGWWVSTNHAKRDVVEILRRACQLVGLEWEKDVRFVELW